MPELTKPDSEPGLATLVSGIAADAQRLFEQQVTLLKREMTEEIRQAKAAAVSLGVGAGILAYSLALLLQMLVHGLQSGAGLSLWASYGIVGGALALIGGLFLGFGRKEAEDVQLAPPPQTAEAVKENIEWLKHPTNSSNR